MVLIGDYIRKASNQALSLQEAKIAEELKGKGDMTTKTTHNAVRLFALSSPL
jgi:hypothetical protein